MLLNFIKREAVLSAASLAAIISAFFVLPDAKYISYIDFHTLALLLALMLTISGAKKAGIFDIITAAMLNLVKTNRGLSVALCALCFFSAMFITNDVALITFVPLAVIVLPRENNDRLIIFSIVLMTIAANLGSMLTPIGNPQNLYLYSYFSINTAEFFKTMAFPALMSLVLLLLANLFINRSAAKKSENSAPAFSNQLYIWAVLFVICVLCVGKFISWPVMLAIVLAVVFKTDRSLFKTADYSLLLTFIAFFIFVGNMQRLEAVSALLSSMVKGRELAVSILTSQVISNVPAAVLLSGFTENYTDLLIGVNLGGLGTPIASMASLISYKQYAAAKNSHPAAYMKVFLIVNIAFLAVLWGLQIAANTIL